MAKLLIYRGDVPHDQVELTEQTVRIGRNPENEIVLQDPGKGVSRTHAEIRFEEGRYVLVDRQSQNGIWVSGRRVTSVVLDPDVVAAVGPFRLLIEAPAAVSASGGPETPTEYTHLSEHPAEPVPVEGIPSLPAETPTPVPTPTVKNRAAAPQKTQPHPPTRTWLIPVAAVIVVAALGFLAYWLFAGGSAPPPVWDRAAAETLVNDGNCQQALDAHITPALTANPDDAEARALRDRCASAPPPEPPPTTTTMPPGTSTAETLDEAEKLIASNDCANALSAIDLVLVEDPANPRAVDLAAKAKACAAPPPPPASRTEPAAVRVPPEEGGLEPLPGESNEKYKARIRAMRTRYDQGVALVESHSYQQALRELDQLAGEVGEPRRYLQLEQLRAQARKALQDQARRAFDAAQAAEKQGDFEGAIEGYRRARALDSTLDIAPALQRIEAQRLELGLKKCNDAQAEYALGFNMRLAAAHYQEVLRLLPPGHACYIEAQERLKRIGK